MKKYVEINILLALKVCFVQLFELYVNHINKPSYHFMSIQELMLKFTVLQPYFLTNWLDIQL